MKKRELERQLEKKQKEFEELQREYNREKYDNAVNTFLNEIKNAGVLLEIIVDNDFKVPDAKLFAKG